jgi:hypothetical protein
MGKKRRMLSATKKFAVKHSNHPRMRAILAATETTTPEPAIKATPPTPKTVAKVEMAPVIEATPEVVTEEVIAAPIEEIAITTPKLKAKTAAPKPTTKTTTKKKATTRKSRRKTTKTKTIDANA